MIQAKFGTSKLIHNKTATSLQCTPPFASFQKQIFQSDLNVKSKNKFSKIHTKIDTINNNSLSMKINSNREQLNQIGHTLEIESPKFSNSSRLYTLCKKTLPVSCCQSYNNLDQESNKNNSLNSLQQNKNSKVIALNQQKFENLKNPICNLNLAKIVKNYQSLSSGIRFKSKQKLQLSKNKQNSFNKINQNNLYLSLSSLDPLENKNLSTKTKHLLTQVYLRNKSDFQLNQNPLSCKNQFQIISKTHNSGNKNNNIFRNIPILNK